jgi:hypothetical protein
MSGVVLFLVSLAQGLGALVFSALVLNWVGFVGYVLVGVLVAVSASLLLIRVELDVRALPEEDEPPFVAVGGILLTAAIFGIAWPAIPIILAWGAWRERAPTNDVN